MANSFQKSPTLFLIRKLLETLLPILKLSETVKVTALLLNPQVNGTGKLSPAFLQLSGKIS